MGDAVTRMEYLSLCGRSSRQLEIYSFIDCPNQRSLILFNKPIAKSLTPKSESNAYLIWQSFHKYAEDY